MWYNGREDEGRQAGYRWKTNGKPTNNDSPKWAERWQYGRRKMGNTRRSMGKPAGEGRNEGCRVGACLWKVASYWDEDEAWEGAFEIATAILEDYEDEADIDDLVASLSESAFFGIEVGAGRE